MQQGSPHRRLAFGKAGEVQGKNLRLLRNPQETRGQMDMRMAFAGVDRHGGPGEPTLRDRALIRQIIRRHRKGKGRARSSSIPTTVRRSDSNACETKQRPATRRGYG